jgi:hypothetical protein
MTGAAATVASREALERQDGRRVAAAGRYSAIAQPRKGPPDPDSPRDHATLTLADGTIVYLEALYGPRARRGAEELARFDGCAVVVTGIAHRLMPSQGPTLIAPCLTDIERVEPG